MRLLNWGCKVSGLITRRVVEYKRSLLNHVAFYMESKTKSIYEEAVYALNGLQSNSVVLQKAREERSANAHLNLFHTQEHLNTLGIQVEDIDSLNIIHVAGTKGKGSTCAFTECILRKHGFKTGFYSSPHLISVNERIRINGQPLSKELFSKYFWEVYQNIQRHLEDGESMPPYFLFLTVMAFYVFVKEKVHATVVEVGIGGLYDCTNVIQNPIAVGITTLGIDHVNILGSTITEIAAQKAGIMKPNAPAFTVSQIESAMNVLRKKAQAVGCSLQLSPPIESYEETISLGTQGLVQNVNASLALQLASTWLQHQNKKNILTTSLDNVFGDEKSTFFPLTMAKTFHVTSPMLEALKACVWPGRFQTIEKGKLTFYLDGAHTQQSMKHCARWFEDQSQTLRNKSKSPILRVLLFNCTGERKAESLLDPLADLHFDLVIFCPNKINVMKDATSDLSNFMVDPEKEIQQCVINKEIWDHLKRSLYENALSFTSTNSSQVALNANSNTFFSDNSVQLSSISSALRFISFYEDSESELDYCNFNSDLTELVKSANHIQVLVTGSLHLVGGVLSLIEQ